MSGMTPRVGDVTVISMAELLAATRAAAALSTPPAAPADRPTAADGTGAAPRRDRAGRAEQLESPAAA